MTDPLDDTDPFRPRHASGGVAAFRTKRRPAKLVICPKCREPIRAPNHDVVETIRNAGCRICRTAPPSGTDSPPQTVIGQIYTHFECPICGEPYQLEGFIVDEFIRCGCGAEILVERRT